MKEAIKVGDIFVVYENPQPNNQSAWYSLGKKLGHFFQQLRALCKEFKVIRKETNAEMTIWNKRNDYSLYEIPAVYRKWR